MLNWAVSYFITSMSTLTKLVAYCNSTNWLRTTVKIDFVLKGCISSTNLTLTTIKVIYQIRGFQKI